jgi:cell wall-associated NlpC family hydrolase
MTPHFPTPVHAAVDAQTEAFQRQQVVAAALTWCGTPYRQLGHTKGERGAIDCSMLLVAAFVEGRVFEPFDPRPYPANWMLSQGEERYLAWLDGIGGRTEGPLKPGDVTAYKFGRCFSHSAIIVDDAYMVHAYATARKCIKTERNYLPLARRPTVSFDMWAKLRAPAP